MKSVIKSNRIYTENGIVSGYLVLENGVIKEITDNKPSNIEIEDFTNKRVIPGIIDIHNHGFGGWSMTDDAEIKDVKGFAHSLATVGVTGVLPTAKEEAFEAIADTMAQSYVGANIYGMHSEGPFWARGGEKTIGLTWPLPDLEETKRLVEKAKGSMKMMAIAPELPNAYNVIKYLHEQNIKVACCHTNSYADDIYKAEKEVKLDIATHLGNGMRGIHHRDVGALGGLLLENNIYYELIADLNHICPDMIRIMFKLQPCDKFCLISDSNYMAGLPTGVYLRYGREMFSDEKGLIKNSDGRICGSGKWVLFNMSQLEKVVGVDFENIVKMASLNPAKFLNIDHLTGSIKVGKQADIAIIDDDFNCYKTYVKGEVAFDKKSDDVNSIFNQEALSKKVRELNS